MNNILAEKKKKKRPGLWANIAKRQAQGKRPHKRGEKGYPKTLDIKEETMKLTSEQLRIIIAEEVENLKQMKLTTGGAGYPDDGEEYDDAADLRRFLPDDLEYGEEPTADDVDAARAVREKSRAHAAGRSNDRGLSAGVSARDSRSVGNESSRRRGKRIAEGHARITEDEVAAWKNGDWGYNAQQDSSHSKSDDHDRFLDGAESGHPTDDEGYMIKSRMSSIKTMASDICGLIDAEDQLPSWVQDLVSSSHSDMQHVYDYLMGDESIRSYTKTPTQNVGSVAGESHLRKTRRLAEGHARITQEEFAAWQNGDWGFVSENSESSKPCDYCGDDISAKDKKAHEQKCSSAY